MWAHHPLVFGGGVRALRRLAGTRNTVEEGGDKVLEEGGVGRGGVKIDGGGGGRGK